MKKSLHVPFNIMGNAIRISVSVISFFFILSCQNGVKKDQNATMTGEESADIKEGQAIIVFDTIACDFGKVYEGEVVGWYFRYRNAGNKDLLITNVTASCGCTTPEFSTRPLSPGQQAEIKVAFDSGGRQGTQFKTVAVYTNGKPEVTELKLTAEVIKK